jgi:cytochrome c-type biogenesis protein CcmH/NrfG
VAKTPLPVRLISWVAPFFFGRKQPKSILRNQTNLPAFFVIALVLSLVCNFALRQSTLEASRPVGTKASIEQLRDCLKKNPQDYELHSQLGELYFQDRQFKRAMFHLSEVNRLIERYGE